MKRSLNGVTTYYIYDGGKPILEYRSGDLSNPAKNVYGKGIDESSEWGHARWTVKPVRVAGELSGSERVKS